MPMQIENGETIRYQCDNVDCLKEFELTLEPKMARWRI